MYDVEQEIDEMVAEKVKYWDEVVEQFWNSRFYIVHISSQISTVLRRVRIWLSCASIVCITCASVIFVFYFIFLSIFITFKYTFASEIKQRLFQPPINNIKENKHNMYNL